MCCVLTFDEVEILFIFWRKIGFVSLYHGVLIKFAASQIWRWSICGIVSRWVNRVGCACGDRWTNVPWNGNEFGAEKVLAPNRRWLCVRATPRGYSRCIDFAWLCIYHIRHAAFECWKRKRELVGDTIEGIKCHDSAVWKFVERGHKRYHRRVPRSVTAAAPFAQIRRLHRRCHIHHQTPSALCERVRDPFASTFASRSLVRGVRWHFAGVHSREIRRKRIKRDAVHDRDEYRWVKWHGFLPHFQASFVNLFLLL